MSSPMLEINHHISEYTQEPPTDEPSLLGGPTSEDAEPVRRPVHAAAAKASE